ncbi:MAG TPA: hypothetical protein VIS07_17065 [Candidatus Binatia bacterium]
MRAVHGALLALALVACDAPPVGAPPDAVDSPSGRAENPAPGTMKRADDASRADEAQVIVRLRFEAPAGAAPDSEVYKSAVARTREEFLSSIADVPHRVVRTYDMLPLVVLSLPKGERAAIERSPLVAGVEDDRLNAPLAQ